MGDADLDATSIAFALNLLAFLPLLGLGQAVEILALAVALGENDPATAARSTWMRRRPDSPWRSPERRRRRSLFFRGVMAELFHGDDATWDQVRALAPVLLRFVAVYCLFDATSLIFFVLPLRGAGAGDITPGS